MKRPSNSMKWKRTDELAVRNILWAGAQHRTTVNWQTEELYYYVSCFKSTTLKCFCRFLFDLTFLFKKSESNIKPSWCRRGTAAGRRWWPAVEDSKTHRPTWPSDCWPDPERWRRSQTASCLITVPALRMETSPPITYNEMQSLAKAESPKLGFLK